MKKIIIYLVATFILTWTIWGILALNGSNLNQNIIMQGIVAVTMWFPALGLALTKLFTKTDKILMTCLRPQIKGHGKYYLAAWFLPALFAILGAVLYFLIFPQQFDTSFSSLTALLQSSIDSGQITANAMPLIVLAQAAFALILAPFFNMLFALGEEIGWRGFLFPALCKHMSSTKAILVSGVIWGLWHTPINMMGHNYGVDYPGYPWLGIIAMCIFCTSMGSFLSWLTLKTNSIWPAALAHGAINAIAGLPIYFLQDMTAYNQVLGPAASGLIAGIPLLVLGIVCAIKMRKQPLYKNIAN